MAKKRDIVIEVRPSLESVFCPKVKEECLMAGSSRIKEQGIGSFYLIKQGEHITFCSGIGFGVPVDKFPFDFLKIIQGTDTLVLKDKGQIRKNFTVERRIGVTNYYLDF